MIRIIVSTRAGADLDAQIDWLAEHSPQAAQRASETLFAAIRDLAEFPYRAPAVGHGQRDLTVRFGRDGFIVRYHVAGEVLTVVRVFHGMQLRSSMMKDGR